MFIFCNIATFPTICHRKIPFQLASLFPLPTAPVKPVLTPLLADSWMHRGKKKIVWDEKKECPGDRDITVQESAVSASVCKYTQIYRTLCSYRRMIGQIWGTQFCYRGVIEQIFKTVCIYSDVMEQICRALCSYRGVMKQIWRTLCSYRGVIEHIFKTLCIYSEVMEQICRTLCSYRGVMEQICRTLCSYRGVTEQVCRTSSPKISICGGLLACLMYQRTITRRETSRGVWGTDSLQHTAVTD